MSECVYTQEGPDWRQGCCGDELSSEDVSWWRFCPTCGRPIARLYAADQALIAEGELENIGIQRAKDMRLEAEGAA